MKNGQSRPSTDANRTDGPRRLQTEAGKRAQRRWQAAMRHNRALDRMIADAVARDTR